MSIDSPRTTAAGAEVTVRSAGAGAKLVRGASLLFTGLFSGFLLGVLVLEKSLRAYDAAVYTQVREVELDSLDKLASATLIPALVCTAVVAVLTIRARGNDRWFVLAAVALLVLVFVTSLAVNLPINGDQADWSVQAPPADWASVRDRWQLAHAVRTVSAVLAFCSLIVGLLRSGRRPSSND
ncbi:MAG: hypothetical protein QOF10_21 [Kribbellaceae bacterium]|nr:hypothetical protein [Kribbellaceae bacterium]